MSLTPIPMTTSTHNEHARAYAAAVILALKRRQTPLDTVELVRSTVDIASKEFGVPTCTDPKALCRAVIVNPVIRLDRMLWRLATDEELAENEQT